MSRILVIDDSRSTLDAIANMLDGTGHQAYLCSSGKRVAELIIQETFDLILTDIFMPDADGLEVMKEVRRLRRLPIVAMSGKTGPLDMLHVAKLLGADQILRKPFSKAGLLAAVEAALKASPAGSGADGERGQSTLS